MRRWHLEGHSSDLGEGAPGELARGLLLFSHSVVSDSGRPHGRQHARLPGPSLPPGVCSDLCSLSR